MIVLFLFFLPALRLTSLHFILSLGKQEINNKGNTFYTNTKEISSRNAFSLIIYKMIFLNINFSYEELYNILGSKNHSTLYKNLTQYITRVGTNSPISRVCISFTKHFGGILDAYEMQVKSDVDLGDKYMIKKKRMKRNKEKENFVNFIIDEFIDFLTDTDKYIDTIKLFNASTKYMPFGIYYDKTSSRYINFVANSRFNDDTFLRFDALINVDVVKTCICSHIADSLYIDVIDFFFSCFCEILDEKLVIHNKEKYIIDLSDVEYEESREIIESSQISIQEKIFYTRAVSKHMKLYYPANIRYIHIEPLEQRQTFLRAFIGTIFYKSAIIAKLYYEFANSEIEKLYQLFANADGMDGFMQNSHKIENFKTISIYLIKDKN